MAGEGLCLRFYPKLSKFGTVVHLSIKIKEKKLKKEIWGLKGPFFGHRKCKIGIVFIFLVIYDADICTVDLGVLGGLYQGFKK